MEESVTYQAIVKRGLQQGLQQGIRQGESAEARKMVLLAGKKKLGSPTPDALSAIAAINDASRLESLLERVFVVSTWDDLMKAN